MSVLRYLLFDIKILKKMNLFGFRGNFAFIICQIVKSKCRKPYLIEWNGYEIRQTPLLYVFVDLKVHNVQKNSYHFDCIDQ